MKNENLEIIYQDIDSLIPYINNARNNKEAVDKVASSIKNFGMVNPILIDSNNEIIAGHTRLLALKKLGYKKTPTIQLKDLSESEIKAYRLVDNKTSEFATWDDELLKIELETLKTYDDFGVDMIEFGFDEELGDELTMVVEDDFDEEKIEEKVPLSKLGQVWKLGKHRLMVGDSTNEKDVSKLMANNIADLVVTDPPYNIAYESKNQSLEQKKIENDNMSSEEFYNFLLKAFINMGSHLKLGGAFYVWYASKESINFEKALRDANLDVKQQLIWKKNMFTLGRQDYQWKHETCLYGWKPGDAHYFIDSRRENTVIEDYIQDFSKMKKDELVKLLEDIYSENLASSIINEDKPTNSDLHPTMKPVRLIGYLIKNSSKREENVLDLFGGSGSTLIACEQLERTCFLVELDEKFCDVIVKRYIELVGSSKDVKLIRENKEYEYDKVAIYD